MSLHKTCLLVAAMAALCLAPTSQVLAIDAAPDTAAAEYNLVSGEIIVSVNSVNNWYIQSLSNALTGAAPVGLPRAGGLKTDNNSRIGETGLGEFSYSDVNLGPVAPAGLPANDLMIWWNSGLGAPLASSRVAYVPEPSSVLLIAAGLMGVALRRRSA